MTERHFGRILLREEGGGGGGGGERVRCESFLLHRQANGPERGASERARGRVPTETTVGRERPSE